MKPRSSRQRASHFASRLLLLAGFAWALSLGTNASPAVAQSEWFATTDPRTPADELQQLRVPPGFAIELVAAEPDIAKPLNMNFDSRGRLWVTSTVEYPIPAPPDRKPRDTVKVLEDSDGDGSFDKVTTFADELNIPIGVLPVMVAGEQGKLLQGAIVHSIPNIYLCIDEDGDGKSDSRKVLYSTFGSDDTHGMTGSFSWGFDGWVYAHHGFTNTSQVTAADGSRIKMQSGNVFRFRPDGARVEQYAWGLVNPYGLCFDPLGDLYAADCHTRPIQLLLRGAYYPSFGKPHDGLGFAPELMTHDHGSTAICGIAYYAADQFPPEYRNTLFVGNVVTNRINRDKPVRTGSSYTAIEQPDFVTSDDPWFRPVDVKLGPDGALYVADFYNRVIAHVEVALDHPGRDRQRGRLWRIYWKGTSGEHRPPRIPDFSRLDIDELAGRLQDTNLTVRKLAASELVHRNKVAVQDSLRPLLRYGRCPTGRVHAMWVLERLSSLEDLDLLKLTEDPVAAVRIHATRILAERKDWTDSQADQVRRSLNDADGLVQRAAADALGRHASNKNFRALLDAISIVSASDPALRHVVRIALRDQLRRLETWSEATQGLSDADARAVAEVALGAPSTEAADFLLDYIGTHPDETEVAAREVHHVARYGREEQTPVLTSLVRSVADDRRRASLLLAVVQGVQERGGELNDEARRYAERQIDTLLAAEHSEMRTIGVELADALQASSAQGSLVLLARRRDLPESQRMAAVSALASIDPRSHIAFFNELVTDATEAPTLRDHAAIKLAAIDLPDSTDALLQALPVAPSRLQKAIAVGLSGSRGGAEALLQAVAGGQASARLLQQREVEFRLKRNGPADLKERLAQLTADLPPADEQLNQLIERRRNEFQAAASDPAAGAQVFARHCGNCHQVANQGARIGPQLDGVGVRGLDRLLEDLVDPNQNVDQAFRSTIFVKDDGTIVSGNVLHEEGQVIVLADQQGKEIRVPKSEIEEQEISQLSLMPGNLTEQLSESDFRNLLGYLLHLQVNREK